MKLLRRLRARLGGYFWLPCPNCGEMFGGHECGHRVVMVDGRAQIVCRRCSSLPAPMTNEVFDGVFDVPTVVLREIVNQMPMIEGEAS